MYQISDNFKFHFKTVNFTRSPIFKIIELVNFICINMQENVLSKFRCNFEKNEILTISKNFKSIFLYWSFTLKYCGQSPNSDPILGLNSICISVREESNSSFEK